MAAILVVIDMQNDFVKGHMSSDEAREIIPNIIKKIKQVRVDCGSVFFTLDTHLDSDYGERAASTEAERLPKHCIKGSDGWRIIEELQPFVTAENTLEKPTFLGLDLAAFLDGAAGNGDDDVIELCGVCTDICVLSNALYLRASYPRAKIVVDAGCCAGLTPESHRAALTAMRSCLIDVTE